jgi:hypothetical protein
MTHPRNLSSESFAHSQADPPIAAARKRTCFVASIMIRYDSKSETGQIAHQNDPLQLSLGSRLWADQFYRNQSLIRSWTAG